MTEYLTNEKDELHGRKRSMHVLLCPFAIRVTCRALSESYYFPLFHL